MVEALEGLKKTVVAVRALGKRVVVIAPPPASSFNIDRCTERLASRLLMIGVADECRISMEAYRKARGNVHLLTSLPRA